MKKNWLLAGLLGCCMAALLGLTACTDPADTGKTPSGTDEPGTEEPGTEEPGTEEPGTEEPGTEEPGTEEPEHTHNFVGGVCECGEQDATFTGQAVNYKVGEDVYTGAMTNGQPDGEGVMTYVSGDVYSGGWSAGVYEGEGRYTFASGMYYEGGYKGGMREGEGMFTWSTDGNLDSAWKFVGTFKENKAYYGKTTTTKPDGLIWYEGYMNDLNDIDTTQRGEGYVYFSDSKCTYTGELFSSGALETFLYDGEGLFTWPGSDLTGTFSNGAPVSGVKWFYAEPENITKTDHYEGTFSNWNYDGEGRYTFASGMYYEGGYTNGLREGEGMFTWSTDGNLDSAWKFVGTFKADKAYYGKTTTTKPDGLIWYEGYMIDLNNIDTTKVGNGYYDYGNGCWYEGEMTAFGALDGCTFSGEGTFSWNKNLGDDVYFVGTFENSQAVYGTKYWPLKTSGLMQYTGKFLNTNDIDTSVAGSGKFVFENGDVYEGGLQATAADGATCTLTGTGLMTYASSQLTGKAFGLNESWTVAACYGQFTDGTVSGAAVWYFESAGAPVGYLTGTFAGTTRTGAIDGTFAYTLLSGYEAFSDSAGA